MFWAVIEIFHSILWRFPLALFEFRFTLSMLSNASHSSFKPYPALSFIKNCSWTSLQQSPWRQKKVTIVETRLLVEAPLYNGHLSPTAIFWQTVHTFTYVSSSLQWPLSSVPKGPLLGNKGRVQFKSSNTRNSMTTYRKRSLCSSLNLSLISLNSRSSRAMRTICHGGKTFLACSPVFGTAFRLRSWRGIIFD